MGASKERLFIVIFVAQLLASILTVWAQTSPSLRNRIPKPDPKKYQALQDGKDWQNPKLFVRPEGIEVIGITSPAHAIPAESVPRHIGTIARLGVAVWLGRGGFGHWDTVTAVRLKVEQNQLVDVFGEIGVGVDGLKGA
jgi:hypothetical protein